MVNASRCVTWTRSDVERMLTVAQTQNRSGPRSLAGIASYIHIQRTWRTTASTAERLLRTR